jgi:hypothetical protein
MGFGTKTGAALSGEADEIANDAASVVANRPDKNFLKNSLPAWVEQMAA